MYITIEQKIRIAQAHDFQAILNSAGRLMFKDEWINNGVEGFDYIDITDWGYKKFMRFLGY